MEKLAAQYTTTSATLTLQAGSRATETLVRLVGTGPSTGGLSKLVLSGVKIRHTVLEAVSAGQEGLAQVRTLEIRACSLAAAGTGASNGGFAVPQPPGRARAQTQSVPPAPYSIPPTPYSVPSTPVQQDSAPPTPQFGPTPHPPNPQRSQTFNSYTYGSTNPYVSTSNRTNSAPTLPLHATSAPATTPSFPGVPQPTPNIPGVHPVPNAPPAPTPGISSLGPLFTSPPLIIPLPSVNGISISLSNLHIPPTAVRINLVPSTPSTPTQAGPFYTEHDTPRANRVVAKKKASSGEDDGEDNDEGDASTIHAPSESAYSADTTVASAGTGSMLGSDSDEDEDGGVDKDGGKTVLDTDVLPAEVQTRSKETLAKDANANLSPIADSSSSSDENNPRGDEEEDETDSNEADGGSELGDLSLDDEPNDGTVTPGGRSVRDRPGTPGIRRTASRTATEAGTGTGGSTSSVNGGTTPRLSGASTPKTTTNPHLQSLRNGLHSASMSNLRAAAHHAFSAQQHSASSSDLHAAFKAKESAQDSRSGNPYARGAFGSAGPNLTSVPRGRSSLPTPKQGGFAHFSTTRILLHHHRSLQTFLPYLPYPRPKDPIHHPARR
ncbi:hypothetical protein FRC12_022556 [Ceratobasidium sp. 428]|nr:hypothetical protein FRC12_022556 [Ceratobasidium sp. 428]